VASSPPQSLDFSLRFVEGRGILGLKERTLFELVGIHRLELEIPQLRFPFDVSGGAQRFQSRRCHLQSAELRVDEARLSAWLNARTELARYGILSLSARVHEGRIVVHGRARVGEREAPYTARVRLCPRPDSQRLLVLITDVRIYSFLPVAAPLIGLGIALGLGAEPADATDPPADHGFALKPIIDGTDAVELNPLELVLWSTLPPSGWRLPRYRETALVKVAIGEGQAVLNYGGAPSADGPTTQMHERMALTLPADRRLARGDLKGAVEGYRTIAASLDPSDPARPDVLERELAVLASVPSKFNEARPLAALVLERWPDRPFTLLSLAAIDVEEGRHAAAAEGYGKLVAMADGAREEEDAVLASLCAGRLEAGVDLGRAASRLERVLAARSIEPELEAEAATVLAERYAAEERWADLLPLEKRRLKQARGQRAEAQARARLGRVWLELGDPVRAGDEFERSVRLDDREPAVLRLLSRALEARGEHARAFEALKRGAALAPDLHDRTALLIAAAELAERSGNLDGALAALKDLVAAVPTDVAALGRLAALLQRSGALEQAVATYEQAIEAASDDGARASLTLCLARLSRDALSDLQGARVYAERAVFFRPSVETLRFAADLARHDGRLEELERLLERLAENGDRTARLERAAVLLELGRPGDAAAELEPLASTASVEALVLLCRAREALGQPDQLRAALEQLVEASPAPPARVRLAELCAAAGELDRARALCTEVLGGDAPPEIAARALETLCDVLLRQGDDHALDESLTRLAATRTDPIGRARALSAQGAARARLGFTARAADAYRGALALAPEPPEDIQARVGLGEAAYTLRQWAEARTAWEPLFDRGVPPRVERALRLGEAAQMQGQSNDALRFYRAALAAGADGSDGQRATNAIIALHHARGDHEAEVATQLAAADNERLNEPPPARAARLTAAGDLLRKRVGRPDEADALYERALTLDPMHLSALDALEAIAEARGDFARSAQVLGRKVAATAKRPAEQKAILGRLAALQSDKLGRDDAAREAYARALEIDPSFAPALRFLARQARHLGDAGEEILRLERLVSLPENPLDPDERNADLARLAQLYATTGKTRDAEAVVRRVLETQPRDARALLVLDEIYTREGRLSELEAVLRMRAEVETDHDLGIQAITRRAAVLEELGRSADAVAVYQHLTSLKPANLHPWNRLVQLLRAGGAWEQLAGVLGRLAEWHAAAGRSADAEGLLVEQAHLAHDRLEDPTRAQNILSRALEVHPKSRLALSALLAIARGRGDPAEVEALLERLAEVEEAPAQRVDLSTERAQLLSARGEVVGALAVLRRIDDEHASDAALRLRVELEEAAGTLPEAAQPLEVLRARARHAGDRARERFALKHLLRLARDAGSPRTGELAARALELDPDDRDAARQLADAEQQRGDLPAYVAALERLIAIVRRRYEGPTAEAEIETELAEALITAGDQDGARARLRDALELAPDYAPALRLYGLVNTDSPAEAVARLERAAELGALSPADFVVLSNLHDRLADPARAAAALVRAGDAAPPRRRAEAAWRAGQIEEGRAAAIEALVADPEDDQVLQMATHGLSTAGAVAQLEELTDRLPALKVASLLRKLAARLPDDEGTLVLERALLVSADATGYVALGARARGPAAVRRYEQALAADPACVEAALGLSREGSPETAARALAGVLERVSQPARRAPLELQLGLLQRDRLGAPDRAREELRRALADAAADDQATRNAALRALATMELGRNPKEAERLFERLRKEGAATDADLRQLGELYIDRGAHESAIPLLVGLPGSAEVLGRAFEGAGRFAELVALCEEEAPRRTPADARALYLKAAKVSADALADPEGAVRLLERALPLGPSDAEIWERLGWLYQGRLGDRERAARAFARALAADRNRTQLLVPLGDFHHDAREWAPARDYYRDAIARGAVRPEDLGRVHLRMAQQSRRQADAIAEEQSLALAVKAGAAAEAMPRLADLYRVRGDATRLAPVLLDLASRAEGHERRALLREAATMMPGKEAARIDDQLLSEDPADQETRDRILERLRGSALPEDKKALIERLERELPLSTTTRRGEYAKELALLCQAAGDDARAVQAFRVALKAAPSADLARGLMEVLSRTRREADAAPILEAALGDPQLPETDRPEVTRLTACAYLADGSDGARALAWIERARVGGAEVHLDPAAYRGLLRGERRFSDLVVALDAAAAVETGPRWLELEVEAAHVLEHDLGRPGDAARRLDAIISQHPGRRDLAARARALYAANNEPIYALAVIDKELKNAPPEEIPQLKIARGELLLQAGADAEAEGEFLHALITTKRVGRAHAALAEVYKKRGDLAGALEHLIAAADAPDLEPMRAAACAVDAAEVLLVEGDTTTAERLYQLAAALDPADRRAVDALARLAAARGDHERHADLLGRAAALTADRRERARLQLARARVFQLELGRELEAYRCFKEAAACDPNLRDAVRGLRELAEARGEWAVVAEQHYREIALSNDDVERARLHVHLGRILLDKLFDTEDALRNFEQAADLAGDALSGEDAPWSELSRLYAEGGRPREAAEAADRLAASLKGARHSSDRAAALSRAGELYGRAGAADAAKARLAEAAAIGGEAGRRADDLLLRLAEEGDPEELRRRIEERLAVESDEELRLELLRRLLQLATQTGDQEVIDQRAQEILVRAPEDAEAFVARKRALEARGDDAGVIMLLRARAGAADLSERAERRFEAGRLAETRLYDVAAAAADYEAAIAADPDHVSALDALADLAYRTRHLSRARTLYAQLGGRPTAVGADEVARRRAELAEEAGDVAEARALYGLAVEQNPLNLSAHQALARLALSRGDDADAYASLKAVLELLPLDAVDRITELRRHLGELAFRLGDRDQARAYLELVLSQDPDRADVLEPLTRLYVEAGAYEEAAELLQRRSLSAVSPAERAELLYQRGEVLREKLGDLDRANDAYLKAADLPVSHPPTLRRLVSFYFREGDYPALADVVKELESRSAPFEGAAVEAGLGIALGGDEARGTVIVAVAQPTADALAGALSRAKVQRITDLDPALKAAARALGGGEIGKLALSDALAAIVASTVSARLPLGRLHDLAGHPEYARQQLAVLAFVDPGGVAASRLSELGPPRPFDGVDPALAIHPGAHGPLRDALTGLGPLVYGLPPAPIDVEPAPALGQQLTGILSHMGTEGAEVAVVPDLLDPAWAEPTRPVRLLIARRAVADPAVLRFAAARALHALSAGLPLVEGRTTEDVSALIRAAAALFLPDLRLEGAFVHAWQAELQVLGISPDALPEAMRAHLEVVLAGCLVDSSALSKLESYLTFERMTADRMALLLTGDLRAGLAALCPIDAVTIEARAQALTEVAALRELVAFGDSLQ
jgi:tetratricopeptide (TPR) repeat protein